ncbi:hypothetical protein [Heyndrickxia acidiproducens]|uniref:hypothetical protein n=1 Tax=Heyndrickxia acidiproducens TaxID=1121084 RepID=UPI000362A5B2|nr:hypothetical protein [Heyndrickxia acidiproducens]
MTKKDSFRIKISKQKAVTTLTAYATDKAASGIPTAGTVTYKLTAVLGKTETCATVMYTTAAIT